MPVCDLHRRRARAERAEEDAGERRRRPGASGRASATAIASKPMPAEKSGRGAAEHAEDLVAPARPASPPARSSRSDDDPPDAHARIARRVGVGADRAELEARS